MYRWIAYDRDINQKALERFEAYMKDHFAQIQAELAQMDLHVESAQTMVDMFEWAAMNVATRCFGHAQVPNEIAMVPLLDLVNHA